MTLRPAPAPNAAARRHILARFEEAGAIGPTKAIAFVPEGVLQRRQFDRLRKAGAIVETEGQRFHLDKAALEEFHRSTRGKVALAIGIAVAGALWALAS